jgi:hypothetical protein
MNEAILLADGVPFQLGMTVFLPIGDTLEYRRIDTDPAIHTIESFVHDGLIYNTIGTTDISFFYSSAAAIFHARANRLRLEIAQRQEELEHVEALAILGS